MDREVQWNYMLKIPTEMDLDLELIPMLTDLFWMDNPVKNLFIGMVCLPCLIKLLIYSWLLPLVFQSIQSVRCLQ